MNGPTASDEALKAKTLNVHGAGNEPLPASGGIQFYFLILYFCIL
jgi:hypothetical protein